MGLRKLHDDGLGGSRLRQFLGSKLIDPQSKNITVVAKYRVGKSIG